MRIRWLILVLALVPTVAQATTYYVATTGNNANSCSAAQSESTPKLTIAAGVACLAGGDTLILKAGTYTNQEITYPPGGTANAYTVIKGDPNGPRPVILPDKAAFQRGLNCYGSACSYIEMRYLEVRNSHNDAKLGGDDTGGYPHHVRIVDNYFYGGGVGILIASSATGYLGGDHYIANNTFEQKGLLVPGYSPGINAIYNTGNRSIVENNVFSHICGGVVIYQGGKLIRDVIVRNNLFYDMDLRSSDTWLVGQGASVAIMVGSGGGGHQIYHNIVYHSCELSSCAGIRVTPYGGTVTIPINIYNNTIYNLLHASAQAVTITPTTGGPYYIRNNIAYLAGVGFVNGTQSNNLTTNPSFTDAANADFTLQSGSAAIDTGAIFTEVVYNGSAPEKGAYEVISTPVASMTTNTLSLTFPINVDTPLQIPSATGLSISCTPNPTACPASPTISSATRRSGADTIVDITIAGIAGNACAAGQDWRVSYNSAAGGWTSYRGIGVMTGYQQKVFSFTNLLSANACTGSGPPTSPGTPYIEYAMDEGIGATLTNTGSAGASKNGTLANGATWGTGHTGYGVAVEGTQQVQIPYGVTGGAVNPSTQSMTWVVAVNVPSGSTSGIRNEMGTAAGTDQRAYMGAVSGTWRVARQATTMTANGASNLAVDVGWNHLCLRWDSGTDTVTLYKNGIAGTGGATGSYTSFTVPTDIMLGITGSGFFPNPPGKYDDFKLFLSLEDCAALYAAWNAPPPAPAFSFSQLAVQPQAVYLPSLGGSPTNFGTLRTSQEVVAGGALAWVFQVNCDNVADCDASAFRLAYKKNGTGSWQQVPDMETADGIWMWGSDANPYLNSGALETRLTGSCAVTNGVTLLTSAQVPSVDLPQDGCTVLRFLVKVGPTAGDYFDLRLEREGGVALTGTVVSARVTVINPTASAGF